MEKLAGAVLALHQPLGALDALISEVRSTYGDAAVDVLESLNAAREGIVELDARPYEPDDMDASREDRQARDDDAAGL